ncbi:MAG: hypothetical protein AAGE94_14100 [Acidobacteriota bacterium]
MKNGTFVLRIAAVLAILCLASAPLMAAAAANSIAQHGTVAVCQGIKDKEAELPGLGVFTIPSAGHISSRVGGAITAPGGEPAAELTIIDFTDSGSADGLGAYTFTLDKRQAGSSWVQQNADGSLTQVMNFHLQANVEALGNTSLRTTRPATVAADLKTFPETGAVYHLIDPIEFVDGDGKVRLRIHNTTIKMVDTQAF